VLTEIIRATRIVFWTSAYGVAIFFAVGVYVFFAAPGGIKLISALCAIIIPTILAFLVYAVRIKLRFGEDWRGLSPREIGVRVYLVVWNGP
jgi:hypothetical protein